ncbi:contact-dependent growth inhibition system immunity protein [Limnobaculum parvum]|uniref:CdiI immunity protein domain-containing protein n=1 Tax=Limnobaculum parvum TaxID=2172103 RepID=A0A2Y9U084_9GAMM|nr:contact-dependent growth inhibition system immunity protein [Limnobaculum parvum]AWH89393.1 hypothetical protein HYN51_13035 [Limnobaculum parvum]
MKTENINYLLSAYFHQDWRCEAQNDDEIIMHFKKAETQQTINELKEELNSLLASNQELTREFIIENDGYYNPEYGGLTIREWLARLLQLLN